MIKIIEEIETDFLKKFSLNKESIYKSYYNINSYLKNLIEYSTLKKDIKTFLLFLYLHDNHLIIRKKIFEYGYKKWIYFMTYLYAYEIQKFTQYDLTHYLPLSNEKDKKLYIFLMYNMKIDKHEKLFVKKYSWIKLKNKFKIYCKVIGKLMLYYKEILEKRYRPEGNGYYECLERYNSNFLEQKYV